MSNYFPVHSHSEFSWLDGIGTVEAMGTRIEKLGQPAWGLTDHGVMAGVIRQYKLCRKLDLTPFPGEEFYLVTSVEDDEAKTQRYHIGLLALDAHGFESLIQLSSRSHQRDRFHRKPLIDISDLVALSDYASESIAVTTGCYFGLPIQRAMQTGDWGAALDAVRMYATMFPYTFVELQNHKIVHDDDGGMGESDEDICRQMLRIARKLGLPVVAGQDSHYCEQSHKPVHDFMKDICYFGDGEDNHFPGDSFHLASTPWIKRHYKGIKGAWDEIEEGHGLLLELNQLILPELETYKFHVPAFRTKHPDALLTKQVKKALHMRGWDTWSTYDDHAKRELKVITTMGMSNYFLIVSDLAQWCRDNGIIINVRGSANGCLVNYLLRITNVDPIEWDTDFDRFLSLDRQKPPDIDIDIQSDQRAAFIEHLRSQFPTLVHIGTYSKLTAHEEEFGVLTGEEENQGSLFVQYQAARKRKEGWEQGDDIPEHHRKLIYQLSDLKARKSPGVHAAGLVLPADDLPIHKYLATMLIPSSNTTVTQAPMDDVEDAGYMKLDFLGLRSLGTINRCLELIGRPKSDLSWIPWHDRKACLLLQSGQTTGIFQFEGFSTKKGAQRMGIRDTHDAILCLALFRPALMKGGQTDRYLEARKNGEIYKLHPLIDRILDSTLGVPVFQEQVIQMMKAVGLPFAELNDMLKAVKASNDKIADFAEGVFKRTEERFVFLATQAGLNMRQAESAWGLIREFSDYGFNKAHATGYGQMSYHAAYLKAHHPLEYMAGLLEVWAGTKKEEWYIGEAKRLKLPIIKPDVNTSEVSWTIDRARTPPGLRKGLVTIKGVGPNAAEAIIEARALNGGNFDDMEDFVQAVPARPVSGGATWLKTGQPNGVIKVLQEAEALRSLGEL